MLRPGQIVGKFAMLTLGITLSSFSQTSPWTHDNAVKHTLLVALEATFRTLHPLSEQSPQTLAALVTPLQCTK